MNNIVKLTLCQKGCCPTIEFNSDIVVIKDDHGGKVSLTIDQFKILLDQYRNMKGES